MKISDQFIAKKTSRVASKQAWARYARRRWPQNAVCMAQAEWDLTDGQARGLVFGHASQPTIDAILKHPRGGPVLAIRVEALAWGHDFETFLAAVITSEQQRLADEERRAAADRLALAEMARRLPAGLGLAPHGAAGVGSGKSRDRVQAMRLVGADDDGSPVTD